MDKVQIGEEYLQTFDESGECSCSVTEVLFDSDNIEYADPSYTVYAEYASGSTGVMLSTLWNQSGVLKLGDNTTVRYNEYCPLDGSTHTLTGCTNTAAAQIIYYFIENYDLDLQLTLTSSDEYTRGSFTIKADGSTPGTISFANVNAKLADYDITSADDAAALIYACGVVQKATYGVDATSTAWYSSLFYRAGFVSCNDVYISNYSYWGGKDEYGNYYISDAGYEVIIENLLAGRVVGTSYPGHALVIDGYDSVNDKFHINFGWGNSSSTRWYSREEMYEAQYYHFVYDLMLEKQEVLTVNDMDVYGTGTAIRAFEMARTITGSNIINFASSIAGKSLEIEYSLDFKEEITVNDFNISLKVVGYSYGFYGYTDVVADFNDFTGDLIVNRSSSTYGFYFSSADSFDFNGSGAIIYAGSYAVNGDYSAGAAAVLKSLQSSQKNSTAVEDFIISSASYGKAFYCTNQQDSIIFDNHTIVVGDIYLYAGDDTLKVINGSHVYGVLSMGDGNDVITVDSTSAITTTSLASSATAFNFELTSSINIDAMLTVTSSLYYYSYWDFSVDISQAAIGVYTLISAAGASYESYLKNISITITGSGDAAYTLNAASNAEGKHANLICENGVLKLDVKGYDSSDKTPPTVPANLKATVYGNGVQLDWSDSTDNNRVEKYFYRYGSSSTLSGDGVAVAESEAILTNLSNGTYYFQVRSRDASGNYSAWSTVKSFVINYVPTKVMMFEDGLLKSSGTILSSKHLKSGGSMFISSGGTTTSAHISSGGLLIVSSGGVASRTVVSSGGSMQLNFSAQANSATVMNSGSMTVARSATASDVIVSGGKVTVSSGGSVAKATVRSGGELNLSNGASATNVVVSSGGVLGGFIFQNAVTSYSTLSNIFSASNVKIAGTAYIYSGATVSNIDVNYGKRLIVSSGGTATIKYNPWSGTVTSYAGAVVSTASRQDNVYFGGSYYGALSSGNSIAQLNISSGLSALVYSGGSVNNVNMTSGVAILSGGSIGSAVASGGSILLSSGSIGSVALHGSGRLSQYAGTVNNLSLNGGSASLSGTVKNVNISSGGVSGYGSNAVLSNVVIHGGSAMVNSGAKVGSAVISKGYMNVYSGGSAGSIQLVQSGANAAIYSGGKAGTVSVGDHISFTVSSGAKVDNLFLNGHASSYIYGSAGSAVVTSRSYLFLQSGCSLGEVTVGSAGRLYLNAGVINSNIIMERGSVLVCDSANIARCNITVNGTLRMSILSNGSLNMQNYTLTFDLQERFVSDAYMVDNLSLISNYKLAVTVSANQASGIYELARGASSFTGSITVKCGNLSGSLALDSSLTLGKATYTLTNSAGYLKLNVANSNAAVLPKIEEYVPGTWATDWQQASEYAKKTGKLIFACYGDKSRCGYAGYMNDKLFEDPEFQAFAKEHLILLYETVPAGKTYSGSPAGRLLYADGSTKAYAYKSGFGATDCEEWMSWLKLQVGTMKGVYIVSSGQESSFISSCGSNANGWVVNSTNSMYINSATLSGGSVMSGGYAFVNGGGSTINTTLATNGYMYIYSGGVADRTTVSGNMYICSGGTANNTTVNYNMYISNGGVANNTVASSNGYVLISSGGVANNTVASSNGYVRIYSGGMASNTTVSSGGKLYISSGGTAVGGIVNLSGYMVISSGGTATAIKENGGYVYVAEGVTVTFASNTVSDLALYTSMTVHSNTVANRISVNSDGDMYIYGGGIANSAAANSYGYIYINGGIANNTAVNSGGRVYAYSSGTANGTVVNSLGYMYISSGGEANNTVISSVGRVYVYGGGTANRTVVNTSGSALISSGGEANNTVISSGGRVYISSGGTVNSTTVSKGGYMYVYSGGTANSTTVKSGGSMRLSSGGVHCGSLQITSGAVVSAYSGSIIDFTISNRTEADGYLINDLSLIKGSAAYTITVSSRQQSGTYKLAQGASDFNGTITVTDGVSAASLSVNGSTVTCNNIKYKLSRSGSNLTLTVNNPNAPVLSGNKAGVAFAKIQGSGYAVEYSKDNFAHVLHLEISSRTAVDTYGMPGGTYQWQVIADNEEYKGNNFISDNTTAAQQLVSDADGNLDVFFARRSGTWSAEYFALRSGTQELVALNGKNRIQDVFKGSADANILVLTDDSNGDALFIDDVYSALGTQARLSQIDEIRAGAGNDIIDLTSNKYKFAGDKVTIYGGAGDDTIWANSSSNTIFGDAGKDRIIGGAGNDVIIGGSGNDSLYGGGGSDTFIFGGNWGSDTVEQLAGGSVTLRFESGSAANWNAATKVYSDGVNRVTVTGSANITLKFGDDAALPAGAFFDAASENIFEDKDKAMLA